MKNILLNKFTLMKKLHFCKFYEAICGFFLDGFAEMRYRLVIFFANYISYFIYQIIDLSIDCTLASNGKFNNIFIDIVRLRMFMQISGK